MKTAFPVPVGSSQKFPLILSFPLLAFTSWQESAGNSGIEPKGVALKYVLSFSFLIIISCKWKGTRLAQDGENLKKQKITLVYSLLISYLCRSIFECKTTWALKGNSLASPPCGYLVHIFGIFYCSYSFDRWSLVRIWHRRSEELPLTIVWRQSAWEPFLVCLLLLYLFLCPALVISCDKRHGRSEEEES